MTRMPRMSRTHLAALAAVAVCLLLSALPAAAQPPRSEPIVEGGCESCTFDTRTFYALPGGTVLESITAGDAYWNFYVDGTWHSSGSLSQVARYQQANGGPCPIAGGCHFDTRSFEPDALGNQLEVVTAPLPGSGAAWFWEWDASGNLVSDGLVSARDGGRYGEPGGPCDGITLYCDFDTRSVGYEENQLVEIVTRDFQRWTYEWYPPPVGPGWQLASSEHLGDTEYFPVGACENAPVDSPSPAQCVLDTMAHGLGLQSITAYDAYYNYDADTHEPIDGACLASVPRYAAGPCAN